VPVRSIELVIVGVLLVFVAAVPSGWQDRRFSRLLPGGDRFVVHRRFRPLVENIVRGLCLVSGIAFIILGVLTKLR
jgi:uncharacterized membrane protein